MSLKALKKTELQKLVPQFRLGKQLGAGGNAIVYATKDATKPLAIKFLLNPDPKRYWRFRDEVLVVTTTLNGSNRVMPIIDHHLPEAPDTDVPWYAMPVATPIRKHLNNAPLPEVVRALADLADGLAELHDARVAHRDIKPENLFFFDGTFRYGDFGIAKFPDSAGLTTTTEPVGPQGYMADEMLRESASADPFKADVFSLAKTLWVLLTNQPYPFLGQYARRGRYCLDTLLATRDFVHEPLDDLLEASTQSAAALRPTARDFAQALRDVLAAQDDFQVSNPLQWAGAAALASGVPFTRMEWTDPAAIVEVVKIFSRRDSLNHFFFPSGGGMDVTDAELTEGGAAILLWHDERSATVLKPVRLTLERLGAGPQASYATLESAALEPLGVQEKDEWHEELLRFDEYNYMALPSDDEPWPTEAARVSRYFTAGMFVLAPKGGLYNRLDTYRGQGNALGRDRLRDSFEYILKEDHQGQDTFGLRKIVRLVQRPPSANTTFLSELDLPTFERLLALDEDVKKLRFSDHVADLESLLKPDPVRDAKRKEVLQLLKNLSAGQFGEVMALMLFGRGDIEDAAAITKVTESEARAPRDIEYLADKFGNDYFLSAVKRFGLAVVK